MSVRQVDNRQEAPFSNVTIPALSLLLEEAVRAGTFPGAQSCVWWNGRVVHRSVHGHCYRDGPSVTIQTLFDVASVTKMVVTTAGAAILCSRRDLDLDAPVSRWLPSFSGTGKPAVTVRHLLAHTSGLPAWKPLFSVLQADPIASRIYDRGSETAERMEAFALARRKMLALTFAENLERIPGECCVYSDLGFIVLGELLRTAAAEPLDRFFVEQIGKPFGLSASRFFDLTRPRSDTREGALAATGLVRPREPAPGQEGLYSVPLQSEEIDLGEVDDDNAYAMGGIAGHAGLFSTADEIAHFGAQLLEEIAGAERLAAPSIWSELVAPDPHSQGPRRALGFDIPADEGSAAGTLLGRAGPRGAIGHLGFTGCSLWIDLDRCVSVALLTNRVFPTRKNVEGIRSFRPAFHDALVQALSGPEDLS